MQIPTLDDGTLDTIARSLGNALIGSDISRIFEACDMADISGESTKWKRIYYTFRTRQQTDRCANRVCQFIETALMPSRWTQNRDQHKHLLEELNITLSLAGLEIGNDGKFRQVRAARTIDEAAQRASRLRAKLESRGVHPEVLRFCRALLLRDENYFHAVFEATKSIADRLRQMTGSNADGNQLVDDTLEVGKRPYPVIAFNRYDSPSLVNEQRGITHLVRGLFFAFRNVTAHEPAITWNIPEEDALDMMATASLIHRKLDGAVVTSAF